MAYRTSPHRAGEAWFRLARRLYAARASFGVDYRQRMCAVGKGRRIGYNKRDIVLQSEVAKDEFFRRAQRGEECRCESEPSSMTPPLPIQKLCGERPILQRRRVASVRQKDCHSRACR